MTSLFKESRSTQWSGLPFVVSRGATPLLWCCIGMIAACEPSGVTDGAKRIDGAVADASFFQDTQVLADADHTPDILVLVDTAVASDALVSADTAVIDTAMPIDASIDASIDAARDGATPADAVAASDVVAIRDVSIRRDGFVSDAVVTSDAFAIDASSADLLTLDAAAAVEEGDALCADGHDNDGDGHRDCADWSCALATPCLLVAEASNANCGDGLDNDLDLYFDCEDWDCAHNPAVTVCSQWQGTARAMTIDGLFDDWDTVQLIYRDPQGDVGAEQIDLVDLRAANDDRYLYLRIDVASEITLNSDNNLTIALDTDNNAQTGYYTFSMGAELVFILGQRSGWYNGPSGTSEISFADIGLVAAPAVTSRRFELAILRAALPDGVNPLFTGNTVRLAVYEDPGDALPPQGTAGYYTFDSEPIADPDPIRLEPSAGDSVRVVTMNVLDNGMLDLTRQSAYQRLLVALQPDVLLFQESGEGLAVRDQIALWLPIGGPGWFYKQHNGLVILSRFAIDLTWPAAYDPLTYRMTPVLLQISAGRSLVIFNAHLSCCDIGDASRQEQADSFIAYVRDMTTVGGLVELPANTPFLLAGDMNLVGSAAVLSTLRDGTIVDTATYGPSFAPDWDGSSLLDVRPLLTQRRLSYTWRGDYSSYWPSRLDYALISDSTLRVEHAFVLDTAEMSSDQLLLYGLQSDDCAVASDHRPVVVDLSFR